MDRSLKSQAPAVVGHYDANYGNFQMDLYAQESGTKQLGEDIGQNSWLTSSEQDRFLGWLNLSPGKKIARCCLWSRRPRTTNRHKYRLFRRGN